MINNRDYIGGMLFLVLSITYGYFAYEIRLFPGDQYESFTARTLPVALAWAGSIVAILMLATADRSDKNKLVLSGLDISLVAKLLVLVLLFAQALEWLGFLLSTIFFLVAGYWLMGERNIKTLFIASVPFAVCFWFLLAKLLEIYLAPGKLWMLLGGG